MRNKTVGIIGAGGHFGQIMAARIMEIPGPRFILYGRKPPAFLRQTSPGRYDFLYYDYLKDDGLPEPASEPDLIVDLIVDLTGPVKQDDGLALEHCLQKGIAYMDIAISNSHLERVYPLHQKYPGSRVMAHFGFFPGLSNLLVSEGFRLQNRMEGLLAGEFPAYAGGGKQVAISLKELLDESGRQKNIIDGKEVFFRMHQKRKRLKWQKPVFKNAPAAGKSGGAVAGQEKQSRQRYQKDFFAWEYPEIASFCYSHPDLVTLERYFRIQPGFANPLFSFVVRAWNSPFRKLMQKTVVFLVYQVKSRLFKKMEPPVQMIFWGEGGTKALVELQVKSGVRFHGDVMAAFVREYLKKEVKPGLYTPEMLFQLNDILPAGDYPEYKLKINS